MAGPVTEDRDGGLESAPMRALLVGFVVLAACTGGSDGSAGGTTSTSSLVASADQPIEWEGVRLESTPLDLFESQDDGETVVVSTDPSTGAYVSAIRDGDRLCITLNSEGENAPEDWCDTAAVTTPEELDGVAAVRVSEVRAAGNVTLLAYGWTDPDVSSVRGPDGTEVEVQRNLPFWAYGFFAVPISAQPATLTLITEAGEELPIEAGG
jgi:hypothetical protein